jgi:membrane protease subunit HflC
MKIKHLLTILLVLIIIIILSGTLYTIKETEQVVITQFGKPIGEPIKEPGLHVKIPFIQVANYFEKRLLEWDGEPNQIPTRDKKYIWVNCFARWRITDPLKFLETVKNEIDAQSRLDDIIDSTTRDLITSHNLLEIVRSSNRPFALAEDEPELQTEMEEKITQGRNKITRKILEQAREITPQYGIEVVDVRIKRVNYIEEVREKVFERMISERKRIAERYRSEGEGQRAEIEGEREKELQRITSEAYRTAQEIIGKADAEATSIYAQSYNRDQDFYYFLKTLETYRQTIDEESWLIFSTDGDYFKYLNKAKPRTP